MDEGQVVLLIHSYHLGVVLKEAASALKLTYDAVGILYHVVVGDHIAAVEGPSGTRPVVCHRADAQTQKGNENKKVLLHNISILGTKLLIFIENRKLKMENSSELDKKRPFFCIFARADLRI
jgi:hypothetical protein